MSSHVFRMYRIARLGALIILTCGALHPVGAGEPVRVASMSIDQLKGVYLGCEQAAGGGRLNGGDVMYCSQVYEALKEKAFNGEFLQMKLWMDRQAQPER